MRRTRKLLAMLAVVGALTLATSATAIAAGPPAPVADYGLFTAVTQVIGNPAGTVDGTHIAVCTVTASNPATDLSDPGCP
ncbi:MAG: hypothetical protein HY680_02600 [Chloroflexi bacterium]|nr:hypothetical protein [Chloroflexota bacterium]